MVEAPKRLLTSALIPFIPRQIMLGTYNNNAAAAQKKDMKTRKEETAATEEKKEKRKKTKRSSETPEADSAPTEALVLDRPNGGTLPGKGKRKGILLSWIAAYLESNGFSKTLAVFRSEAQSEINGGETSFLNSEDLFYNFLESRSYAETTIDLQKEQDSENVRIHGNDHCNGKVILDATEHVHSKKRKSINRIDDGTKAEIHKPGLVKCSDEHINTDEGMSNKIVDGLEVKSEEKEANKFSSEGCSARNSGISGDKNLKELKTSADKTYLKVLVSADGSRVESKDKKKKNKRKLVSDSLGEHAEKCHLEGSHGKEDTDQENKMPKPHENDKEKRKKKHQECEGTLKSQEMGEEKIEELESLTYNSYTPSAESNLKHKDEKKKKTKSTSDSLSKNVEQLELEASQEVINKKPKDLKSLDCETNIDFKILNSETNDASIKNTVGNTDSEMKDKKKKKGKPVSGSLHAVSSDQLEGGPSHDGKEGYGMSHKTKDVMGRSDSGKEKKVLVSEDIDSEKVSKKKKRLASEEKASQAENEILTKESDDAKLEGAGGNNGTGTHQKPDKYLQDNEYSATGKKRKTKKSNEKSTETVKTSPSEQHNILSEDKENPSECDSQKVAGHRLANGNLEKKEREGDTSSKATEKENRSAEPKTVKAFRRVKHDEVTDERFRDNSYWAKGGAEEGYGAKAQEILGQVRGRDFRHEKTKKKRGTYRGGQIDLQSHSIKFDYSDGE